MKANDRRVALLKELLGTNYEVETMEDMMTDRFAVTVRDKTTKKTVTEVVSGSGYLEDAILASTQHCIYRLEHPEEPQGHFVKEKFVYNDPKDEEEAQREMEYFDKTSYRGHLKREGEIK